MSTQIVILQWTHIAQWTHIFSLMPTQNDIHGLLNKNPTQSPDPRETNVRSARFCLEMSQGHRKLMKLVCQWLRNLWIGFVGENLNRKPELFSHDFPMIFSWGLNRFHFSPTNQSIDSGNLRKRVLRLCGTGCLASLCRSTPENLIRHCPFAANVLAGFGWF